MNALVVNAVGGPFDFEDVDIAGPIGREVLVDVRASGLCHTDMLFATNPIFPTPAVFGHEVRSGRVVINGMTDDPQAPWGGFKYSGVGREYGRYGIEAFLEPKAIM